jgi:hypothetical protein
MLEDIQNQARQLLMDINDAVDKCIIAERSKELLRLQAALIDFIAAK